MAATMAKEEDKCQPESSFRLTMADGLRPLIKLNYFLGVSPFTITSSGLFVHPRKTFNLARVVLTLLIISVSALSTLYRMAEALLWSPLYDTHDFARFNKMVELISQFLSNLCPLMLIFIGLFKGSQVSSFFQEMGIYNAGIYEFSEPQFVRIVSRRFFIFHLTTMTVSVGLLQLRFHTSLDPTETFWRKLIMSDGYNILSMAISSVTVIVLVGVKHTTTAFLECFSVALATCFTRVIGNLSLFILDEAEKWDARYLGRPKIYSKASQYDGMFCETTTSSNIVSKTDQLASLISSNPCTKSGTFYKSSMENSQKVNVQNKLQAISKFTPGKQICFVIRKMQRVSKMQNTVNSLFGTILALELGFTVFMVVLLKYLLIRNLGVHITKLRATYLSSGEGDLNNRTEFWNNGLTSGDINTEKTLNTTSLIATFQHDNFITSPYGWWFFLGFDVIYSLRIIILTKCLGNVHKMSMRFNGVISKVLGMAEKLVDKSASSSGNAKGNEENSGTKVGRDLITSIEADTALAFLTVNSSQPIAFSAGGLLTFSESTIMLIISVVISYVVFLLQA